jgi:hypothetical protein
MADSHLRAGPRLTPGAAALGLLAIAVNDLFGGSGGDLNS